MTPQSSFLYAARIEPARREDLRRLLLRMNRTPGVVDPLNPILPFAHFDTVHFARLLIVTDLGEADRAVYGLPMFELPDYLVLLGEIDGAELSFRKELVRHAEVGLRTLFSYCSSFENPADLAGWLGRHRVTSAANYGNWLGRTVRQVGEENQLRQTLETFVDRDASYWRTMEPRAVCDSLKAFVAQERKSGRLSLTPEQPTPLRWRLGNLAHLIGVPLLLLLVSPLLLLYLPFFLIQLRHREKTDPPVAPPLNAAHAMQLAQLENHDVTNQFSVFGSVKPGRFRRWSMHFFLFVTDYAARHVYHRGHLARVSTIHFARWVPFDGSQRLLFSSIYDGSLESYMDDFINKVGFGLNVTFSGGIGYPRTRWLLFDGCKDEQVFKRVLRRHQLPTEVWWSAHPGLTAADKRRNGLIRDGLDKTFATSSEMEQWLQLF